MKLTHFQLEQQLKNKLAAIYIISGDELLLKQDAIQLIRKNAKLAGFSERIRITPEAGFDWEQLYSLLYANSLMAEKRMLELDFRDMAPTKIASTILQAYGEKPVEDNILLIDIGKLDEKITRSAWYKSLEKTGMVVAIWPIPREQLPQWIIARGKKYKLTFTPDAANLLADYIEGNLVAAAQAIEKIYLLKSNETIDSTTIQAILTDESRFTVFDLIEHLIAGNKARALHVLESLKTEGTEAVLVLWAITRELRLLADMAQQLKSGLNMETMMQKNRIFAKRQAGVKQFLRKFTAEDCWQYLLHANEIDKTIKGVAPGNTWAGLQLLCLRVAG
ncbi:MAG: DNA polymerase III subunit delta [Gammaproteobacteria bacterium]